MKTTIEIRDELFYFAKEEALRRRTTLRAVIEGQLEEMHRIHLKTSEVQKKTPKNQNSEGNS